MKITYRSSWRHWVTPKLIREEPRHRWFVFPHSFSSQLVSTLTEEWELGREDYLLDPFVGAGTTTLSAKERGIPAKGYDLSPLAAFATRTKIADYSADRLQTTWTQLNQALRCQTWSAGAREYPTLVQNALPGHILAAFDSALRLINQVPNLPQDRDFFGLALLGIIPYYSRAVASGGWLEWVDKHTQARSLPTVLGTQVQKMLVDVSSTPLPARGNWQVAEADARSLPDPDDTYSGAITSPPYPNRHDYTRVFGVELMFGFLDWEGTRGLRYQSFESHPEARPVRPENNGYQVPGQLERTFNRIRAGGEHERIVSMLEGYFLDMYLCLREVARVCRPGAKIAFVVGNTQYSGEPVLVDTFTAQLGEQVGLCCDRIVVARYRGNSPQQMREHGRHPSRESIVIFHKP